MGRLAPFFAYYSLVSFADSKIKTKHQYFGAKICYLPFCLYFLSFFPAKNKIPSKARKKRQQLKVNRFRLFELKTTTKISRANHSYYTNSKKKKKRNSNPRRQNFNLLRKQKTTKNLYKKCSCATNTQLLSLSMLVFVYLQQ